MFKVHEISESKRDGKIEICQQQIERINDFQKGARLLPSTTLTVTVPEAGFPEGSS